MRQHKAINENKYHKSFASENFTVCIVLYLSSLLHL